MLACLALLVYHARLCIVKRIVVEIIVVCRRSITSAMHCLLELDARMIAYNESIATTCTGL